MFHRARPSAVRWIIGFVVASCVTPALAERLHQTRTLTQLRDFASKSERPDWTYVICHGMGGTKQGDRFEQLCNAIAVSEPGARVVLIDWTGQSQALLGVLPNPFRVARRLPAVSAEVADDLRQGPFDGARTTFIGESCGVHVLALVAKQLSGVARFVAMNPPNEQAFTPIPLYKVADLSWSFHTYSPYDTLKDIAHHDFFLETCVGASHLAQHTYGVCWLCERILSGDLQWLYMRKPVPKRDADAFQVIARLDGQIELTHMLRTRPAAMVKDPR